MKALVFCVESALANSPVAVRVVVIVLASLVVFAIAVHAGTSMGRALYYLSH